MGGGGGSFAMPCLALPMQAELIEGVPGGGGARAIE